MAGPLNAKVILSRCSGTGNLFGVRVEQRDGLWFRTWAFKIDEMKARNEEFDLNRVPLAGDADEYPGCPHCGDYGMVHCKCDKVSCGGGIKKYNGRSTYSCPWCGKIIFLDGIEEMGTAADNVKNAFAKGGKALRIWADVAGTFGEEILKTGAVIAVKAGGIAANTIRAGYEAIGGTEGVEKIVDAAGNVLGELLKISAKVVQKTFEVGADVVNEITQESRRKSQSKNLLDYERYLDDAEYTNFTEDEDEND
ncbi:MAG: hypothetical protein LBQ88_14030 [Treponema sp.]|jgi:predicted RNA-binding Zn-ribbon protein involved in translation (DUF1610 family)|nr:hypothetical protein [Treponema sp.]